MSLQNKIKVNTHYTRSINLERDAESAEVIRAYIPTSRALRTLSAIASSFNEKQAPRAWSLIGPYGSGKSSFSVFLSQLVSQKDEEAAKAATDVLKKTDKNLAKLFLAESKGGNGYLKILVTGSPEPMARRILRAISIASEGYFKNFPGAKPKVLEKTNSLLSGNKDVTGSDILEIIKELQFQLAKKECKGILLVIDELGKFLEYEARHYGANDIYFLQTLAEHACEGNSVNLYLFVLLHQSFEQYAKGLGESLRNEWSKIQGRFEEVPFLESSEQVLRVVAAAFEQNFTKSEKQAVNTKIKKDIKTLRDQDALPGSLSEKEAIDLFSACYPLHPVSAILLPILCQKVAQNERTLFSYLGSHEEHGFQEILSSLDGVDDYVMPNDIYDYFVANQAAVMSDYLTHRKWTEVVTAVERLGDATLQQIHLLKIIGILNIVGSKAGFKASKAILETCSKNNAALGRDIKALEEKSVVNYRKFNKEYRVWQGSDFDLEAAFEEESRNLGIFSISAQLNKEFDVQPIVARRYTITNGTLRYFIPLFTDAQSYKNEPISSDQARIIFFIAGGQDDEKLFHREVVSHFSELDVVALCYSGPQLREAISETLTLKRVQISSVELNTDPVAKREFEDRLTAAEHFQDKLVQSLFDDPESCEWWSGGQKQVIGNKRAFQELLSSVLSHVFCSSPIVFNELINRDKPSTQANAARNKLLFAMLNHENEKDLGINKFPPEKAIYRALLRETGIHVETSKDSGQWQFENPKGSKANKSNIKAVWKRIDDFLASTEEGAKSFADLNKELMSAPYGVKAGLLPILYIASYIVNQHELAIYEKRVYRPVLTEEMLDRFVKRPDEFTIQRFRIVGVKASIFKEYGEVIQSKAGKMPTLLELAKPLAAFMADLPEYTQSTRKGLSDKAQAVRNAFHLSKSPEKLLFDNLPKALGYSSDGAEGFDGFSEELKSVLGELKKAYDNLLIKQTKLLANATKADETLSLAELRKVVHGHYAGLEQFTVDAQGLRPFIMRLTKSTGSNEEWLENILTFLGHKPSAKWLDSDQDQAEYRLATFSKNLLDLRKIRLYEDAHSEKVNADFDVYLLRSFKKGGEMYDQVVAVDKESKPAIADIKFDMMKRLEEGGADKELRLAVLAELVDEFMIEYHSDKQNQVSDKVSRKAKSKKIKEAKK